MKYSADKEKRGCFERKFDYVFFTVGYLGGCDTSICGWADGL